LDQEILASQVSTNRFPFPHEGDVTPAVRNANYGLGPVMLHLVMQPGSVIPAHIHEGIEEVLYVVQGDFINEGKTQAPGTSLHVKAGHTYGPHSTKDGCALLALWTAPATPKSQSRRLRASPSRPSRCMGFQSKPEHVEESVGVTSFEFLGNRIRVQSPFDPRAPCETLRSLQETSHLVWRHALAQDASF
jgi:mannose-6-phosphate isomerase-like protein (cupin superfamily)